MHTASPAALPLPARHFPRPRLTRLLDDVSAQAVLITAPAGYGKTTLAAEWLATREQFAWYRATPASADLAVFSIGVAEAVTPFAHDALRRVSHRLQVGDQPEHAVQPLAEVLADDLAGWPEDAWLAIDDYHLVMQSPTVDRFVATLLELAPIRVVVTSRRRPQWATARKLLYGELVEVGPGQLAMEESEAAKALGDRPLEAVRALVDQADGWPALIGMAALTSSLEVPTGRVSDMLFQYFAEEVLRQEPPEVQDFMLRAAVPSSFSVASARSVLGVGEPAEIVERLKDEGLLQDYGEGALGFHPLLREFLRSRLEIDKPDLYGVIVEESVAAARAAERWDEAFELASSAGRRELMVEVVKEAAPWLLAAERLETIDRWLEICRPVRPEETRLRVLRALLLRRFGRFVECEALIRAVIGDLAEDDPSQSVAWRVLGSALYAQSRYEEALEASLKARDVARTSRELTEALWSAVTTAAVLDTDAIDQLAVEMESIASPDPSALLLKASARVTRAARSESLAGLWASLEPLMPVAEEAIPLARLKFLNAASYVAVSRSAYASARRMGQMALQLGQEFNIGEDLTWPLIQLAASELGLREFSSAAQTLKEIEARYPKSNQNAFGQLLVLRAKLALFRSGPTLILAQHDPKSLDSVDVATAEELSGLVEISAAAAGAPHRIQSEARPSEQSSTTIEGHFYPRFARLISRAVLDGDAAHTRRMASELLEETAAAEFTDAFVIAYRAYPSLLKLAGGNETACRLVESLLIAANDGALASKWGYGQAAVQDPRLASLTRREAEVLRLLAEGYTNAEIADRLVVSHSTAKVHVHNILRKLDVHTRTQAVVVAQRLHRGGWPWGFSDLPECTESTRPPAAAPGAYRARWARQGR